MDFFKTWILPTVIGAIIGYFTNWLAIKMLFRPLKPVYVGRLKLPFTPGILPRERERLARSVGDTVSRELLTPEVFKARLGEPALRDKVELSVRGMVDQLLAGDASALISGLANLGRARRAATPISPKPRRSRAQRSARSSPRRNFGARWRAPREKPPGTRANFPCAASCRRSACAPWPGASPKIGRAKIAAPWWTLSSSGSSSPPRAWRLF